jgi:hypothetical protein
MHALIPFVILSIFAVFGMYCLVRLLFGELLYEEPHAALLISDKEALYLLPERLNAIRSGFSPYKTPILIVVPPTLWNDPELRELLPVTAIGTDVRILISETAETTGEHRLP